MNTWLAAAGLGAVTGLRSMSGLAAASLALSERGARDDSGFEHLMQRDTVAYALSALALGELVADKLPDVPDRVDPAPLVSRGILGAAVGALAAGRGNRLAGALLGGVAALAAAWGGWVVRKEGGWATGLPDPVLGLVEDGVTVVTARASARAL